MIHYQTKPASNIDPGKARTINEDFAAYFEPDDPTVLENSGKLFVLADGVGGSAKGEVASQFACRKLLYEYFQKHNQPITERLSAIITQIGNQIHTFSQENPGLHKMATTLVAAVLEKQKLIVANVGDSRAYLLQEDKLTQITQDHSYLAQMVRDGVLSKQEAETSTLKNKITRSLGGEQDVEVDIFTEIQVQQGDKLLLCSDGLTRYVDNETLRKMLQDVSPEEITQRLIDYANEQGGEDNISVLVVEISDKQTIQKTVPRKQLPEPVNLSDLLDENQQTLSPNRTVVNRDLWKLILIPVILIFTGIFSYLGFGPLRPTSILKTTGSAISENQIQLPTGTNEPTSTPIIASPTPGFEPALDTPQATAAQSQNNPILCEIEFQQPEPSNYSLFLFLRDVLGKNMSYRVFIQEYADQVTCAPGSSNPCSYDRNYYEWVEPGWILLLPDVPKNNCQNGGGIPK